MATGSSPRAGFALIDGKWLRGIAGGTNLTSQAGITAHAGGTKAAAFQLPANVALLEVDTVANANDSCLLPSAVAGSEVTVFNNGANNLALYARSTDVINQNASATSYVLTPGQTAYFACAKNGIWAAAKSA